MDVPEDLSETAKAMYDDIAEEVGEDELDDHLIEHGIERSLANLWPDRKTLEPAPEDTRR